MQTHEDSVVRATHPVAFYLALLEAGVSAEMHIFQFGRHGLGLAPGDPHVGQWPELLVGWMRRSGFLTGKARVAIEGTADEIRGQTGCDDLEDAFVSAIKRVEPAT